MFYLRGATGLLALLAIPPFVSTQAVLPKASSAHCGDMQFRDFGEFNGDFVVIHGVIGPWSFFKNLRCVNSADKIVFMDDMGEARTFPDRLTITLSIVGPVPKNEYAQPGDFDTEYMLGLSFKANWKRGLNLRPVKAFRQLTASVSQAPDLVLSRQRWIYEFVVEDAEVPLTDHLVLYIISPENKRLARLSASL